MTEPGEAPPWLPAAEEVRDELPGRKAALDRKPDSEFEELVLRRYRSLAAELPPVLPSALEPVAHDFILYSVAAVMEDRLFPEQASGDGSNAQRLDLRAGAELARLRAGLATAAGGTGQEWAGSLSARGRY